MMTLDDSLLALGSSIAGIGVLVAGLLALLFRHPNAPRWTRPEIVALLICVPVTATIGFGLGYAAYGTSQLLSGAGDPRDLLVVAAVVIVLALAWRGLRIRQRLKDYAVATGTIPRGSGPLATAPSRAIGEAPQPRPGRTPSGRSAA